MENHHPRYVFHQENHQVFLHPPGACAAAASLGDVESRDLWNRCPARVQQPWEMGKTTRELVLGKTTWEFIMGL